MKLQSRLFVASVLFLSGFSMNEGFRGCDIKLVVGGLIAAVVSMTFLVVCCNDKEDKEVVMKEDTKETWNL